MADDRAVVLIPVGETVQPADLSAEQVAAGNAIGKSAQFQTDWDTDPATGDMYPLGASAEKDSGIGTLAKGAGHLILGNAAVADGMEGAISRRPAIVGGGVEVIGSKQLDPQQPIVRPIKGDAYVELNGSAVLVATGGLWIEMASPLDKDHELLIGPSTQIADGRYFSPLVLGGEKVYTYFDEATDPRDLDVLDVGEVLIVSLTMTNDYAADVSSFSFSVLVENTASKLSLFDIILKLDGVEVDRYPRSVSGGELTISDTAIIGSPVSTGQVATMYVEATGTNPQSQAWVRGATQASKLRVQQG